MGDHKFRIGSFESLPLAYFPYIATPFAFAYTADFAYGSKAERINMETQNILRNESHWFNNPIVLPAQMKPYYEDFMEETRAKHWQWVRSPTMIGQSSTMNFPQRIF